MSHRMKWFLALATAWAANAGAAESAISQWVHPGPDGKLTYKFTPPGDRI